MLHTMYYKKIKNNDFYTEVILIPLKEYSLNTIIHTFYINVIYILFYSFSENL